MKYNIKTYEDYLNISLKDEEQITADFDLYTDEEMSLMDAFHSQFQLDLMKAEKIKNKKQQNNLVIENEEHLLTDEEFYNLPHWKILKFFGGNLNESKA